MIEAIVWRFRTGSPWRELPAEFGPWKRLDRWSRDGTWARLLAADVEGAVDRRRERDLGNAARTVIANQGTLLDVPRLFWDAGFRAAALKRVTNRHVREFWALWERIGRTDRQLEQLEATINRLDQFLGSEFVSQVVGSTSTTIPFDEVLDEDGRVLLLSLPVGEIGEGLCNLLGSLFLAVLTERILARARLSP